MIVIDDLLPKILQDDIEHTFTQGEVDWKLVDFSSGPIARHFEDPDALDGPQFIHMSFHAQDSSISDSVTKGLMMNVLWFLQKEFDFELQYLHRIKNNCTLINTNYADKHHPAHVDSHEPDMYTCAYYINDSDGDLFMFDREGNITNRVQPKKGRCVIFKSNEFHAGTCPTLSSYRIMSNIIFKPNKDFI